MSKVNFTPRVTVFFVQVMAVNSAFQIFLVVSDNVFCNASSFVLVCYKVLNQ